eukprot:361_1
MAHSILVNQVSDSSDDSQALLSGDAHYSRSSGKRSKRHKKQRNKHAKREEDNTKLEAKPKPTFSQWLFHKPFSKLPFIYFVAGVLGVFGLSVFHFMDADTAYIICGAYIVLSIFGIKHFYTLIGLKQQVDHFGSLNLKFHSTHDQIKVEVNRLSEANDSLRDSQNRIQEANAKNRENLSQFHGIQDTMKTLNLETVDDLTDIAGKAKTIGDKWAGQLIERERDMLHTVFDRYEMGSGKDGMTRKDFDEFSLQLPSSYQQRFARLGTFRKVAGDGKIVKFSDFDAALDTFAEMEALDCDIEFEIQKPAHTKPSKQNKRAKPSKPKPQTPDSPFDDGFGLLSDMKLWKTRHKPYHNVSRKVVVKSKNFLSRQAKDFTASLGILEEQENAMELLDEEEEEDEFDEEQYFSGDMITVGSTELGRNKSVDDIMSASERYALLHPTDATDR